MMFGPRRIAGALLWGLLLLPCLATAEELKLATWNLEWLTDRPAGDPELPADVHPKRPEDIERLRHYAAELNADIIALQEVDGPAIAARIFPSDQYSILMSHDRVVQRVGVAVRRGISYSVNPDLTGLDVDPGRRLRSGVDITLHPQGLLLRILAVHLKTGCLDRRLNGRAPLACAELREQMPPLVDWISARRAEGVAFAILGDFNRHMDRRDQLWSALRHAAPLTRATEGNSSPCWGGEAFIDHIILGGAARNWAEPESLRVLVYREIGDDWKERLSDHCPVAVNLHLPD
jgi:endonuclease/exonuclease/phosphatase family metal-dependent hydrolase